MKMDDAFGHWLAGFIDGEGCFVIYGRGVAGRGSACKMTLALRGDDIAILEEIVERTGLGRVRSKPDNDRALPQYAWLVDGKADCISLVRLLDRYPLRAKKARDFAIWREAVADWSQKRGSNRYAPQDWTRMQALERALKQVRRFDGAALVAEFALPRTDFGQLVLE